MSSLTPNANLQSLFASSALQKPMVEYLKSELQKEREVYENNPANEFTRGRVIMLRDILSFMIGSKKEK